MAQRRAAGLLVIAASLGLLLLVLAFSQNTSLTEYDQHRPDPGESLGVVTTATTSIGQSLNVSHANFDAFQFRVGEPQLVYSGKVKLRLLAGGPSGNPIALQLTPVGGLVSFVMPDLPAGHYYVELRGAAADLKALDLIYTLQDQYSGGQLFVDGKPLDGDLSFRASYRYYLWQGLLDTLSGLVSDIWLVVCALLLYLLPGRAILSLLPLGTLNFAQRWLAAPFVLLCALPLVLLWLKPTGLLLGGWQMWLILLASAGVVLWDERRRLAAGDGWRNVQGWWAYALLGGYLALAIMARLLNSRPLAAGSGIDGYHHSLITQMIMERGALPGDYLPYVPLSSFTYHYGFHAFGAALGWLSGADSVTLMLVTGQVLSAIIAASIFVFVEYIWRNRVMALAAAFIVDFLAFFPFFYVNWSRYTQLAGLAALPVAILLLAIALRQPRLHWGSIALAVVSGAGLLLVHYRIWITYASFVFIYALARVAGDVWKWRLGGRHGFEKAEGTSAFLPQTPAGGFLPEGQARAGVADLPESASRTLSQPPPVGEESKPAPVGSDNAKTEPANPNPQNSILRRLPVWIASLLLTGVLSLLVMLPWLLNLRANFITRIVNNTSSDVTAGFFDLDKLIGRQPLSYYSTYTLLALALLGAALLLWQFDGWGWLLVAWVGVHTLLSNPYWLRLPGAGLVDNVTLVQSSFLPGAIFAGYTVAQAIEWVAKRLRLQGDRPPLDKAAILKASRMGLAIVTLTAALAAIPPQLGLLDAKPYVTAADRAAADWIGKNVPPNALFLVSDFGFDWAPTLAQGSDAGLWLPLLARPAGSQPPAQTPRSTAPPQPAYNEQISDSTYLTMTYDTTVASTQLNKEAAWQTLQHYGVTNIYIGSRGGALRVSDLAKNPHAVLLWHQDDAWVYRIDYTAKLGR